MILVKKKLRNNWKDNKLIIVLALVVLVSIATSLFLLQYRGEDPQTLREDSFVIEDYVPKTDGSRNMIAGNAGDAEFDALDPDALAPTTLSEDEVLREVSAILDGLKILDPASLERVSPQAFGGERNPFYHMLRTAEENRQIGEMFKVLGAATTHRVVGHIVDENSPNAYRVFVEVQTPYAVPDILSYSRGDKLWPIQELSFLGGSGAATVIANAGVESLPVSTDVIVLNVLVVDDEPVIVHATSLNYGTRIPQYAFLWGGHIFGGISGGDLISECVLGAKTEVSREHFMGHAHNVHYVRSIEQVLSHVQNNNFDAIREMSVGTSPMSEIAYFMFAGNTPSENSDSRARSLQYSMRFFEWVPDNFNFDNPASPMDFLMPRASVLITYSVVDPASNGRAYYTQIVSWTSSRIPPAILAENFTAEEYAAFESALAEALENPPEDFFDTNGFLIAAALDVMLMEVTGVGSTSASDRELFKEIGR